MRDEFNDTLVAPDVISRGQNGYPSVKEFSRAFDIDTGSACNVFAIGHDDINLLAVD